MEQENEENVTEETGTEESTIEEVDLPEAKPEDGILTFIKKGKGKNPKDEEISINLADAFPLTLGDWKVLSKKGIFDGSGNLQVVGGEGVGHLLLHLVNKVDSSVTMDMIDTIPLTKINPAFNFALVTLQKSEGGDLDPTIETISQS